MLMNVLIVLWLDLGCSDAKLSMTAGYLSDHPRRIFTLFRRDTASGTHGRDIGNDEVPPSNISQPSSHAETEVSNIQRTTLGQ